MRRLCSLVLTLALLASACGGDDDDGSDLQSFCSLLETGPVLALESTEAVAADYEALLALAPPEIRDAVTKLQNSLLTLDEIPEDDIGGLFAATFDPDAQAARTELVVYAGSECAVELVGGALPEEPTDHEAAFRAYAEQEFSSLPWSTEVRYTVASVEEGLTSIEASFRREPRTSDATSACVLLSQYLFTIAPTPEDAEPFVEVTFRGEVIIERRAVDRDCQTPP